MEDIFYWTGVSFWCIVAITVIAIVLITLWVVLPRPVQLSILDALNIPLMLFIENPKKNLNYLLNFQKTAKTKRKSCWQVNVCIWILKKRTAKTQINP